MNIFTEKNVLPMLFKETKPFDSDDYIYEIKFDGYRGIVYLDKEKVTIRSRNNKDVTAIYPELHSLNKCCSKKCILDGELIVMGENGPDFFKMQKRGRMKNKDKIEKERQENPVIFVVFDILYYDNQDLTSLPLITRKKYLEKYIKENDNLIISKYIYKDGKNFFQKIKKQGLEGVVAKKIDSPYIIGKRTNLWAKFKAIKEDDFWILGYKEIDKVIKTILVGKKINNKIVSYGEVNFPNYDNQQILKKFTKNNKSTKPYFNFDNIVWLKLGLKATIRFKEITDNNSLRHATFMKFVD